MLTRVADRLFDLPGIQCLELLVLIPAGVLQAIATRRGDLVGEWEMRKFSGLVT